MSQHQKAKIAEIERKQAEADAAQAEQERIRAEQALIRAKQALIRAEQALIQAEQALIRAEIKKKEALEKAAAAAVEVLDNTPANRGDKGAAHAEAAVNAGYAFAELNKPGPGIFDYRTSPATIFRKNFGAKNKRSPKRKSSCKKMNRTWVSKSKKHKGYCRKSHNKM